MGGGSASSHSNIMVNSTISAPGTGHLIRGEKMFPGVEQVKRLHGRLTGLTAEKDAPFKVGNTPSLVKIKFHH